MNAASGGRRAGRRPVVWVALGALAVLAAVVIWMNGQGSGPTPMRVVLPTKIDVVAAPQPPPRKQSTALKTEEVKYLQDAEHLGGFVLGDLTFPRVSAAIKASQRDTLLSFFDPQFAAKVFDDAAGLSAELSTARVTQWKEGDAQENLDRDQFVDRLLQWRGEFDDLKACEFKVMLMSPATYGDLAGPWAGSFKLRLAGKTSDGKVAERVVKFRCRVKQITEETPDKGEWMTACDAYGAFHGHADDFLMEDMTAETGIDVAALRDNWNVETPEGELIPFITGGLFLADYNQDGFMDLFVTDFNGNAMYQGLEGGKFRDVTEQVGLPGTSQSASDGVIFADLDNDGFEDLILGQRLYRNVEGRRFRRVLPGETTLELPVLANQFSVVDYDHDGKLDLYVTGITNAEKAGEPLAWIGGQSHWRNQMWRNLGGWKFEDVTAATGTVGNGGPAFAAAWFDATGDGWPDVMTAVEMGADDFFINQRDGTFKSGKLPEGYGGFSMGITVGDINNDGFGDPLLANMYSKAGERVIGNLRPGLYPPEIDAQIRDFVTGNELYLNRGDGQFDRWGKKSGVSDVGWAYGCGYMDLNGDGWLDAYAPVGFQSIDPNKPDG